MLHCDPPWEHGCWSLSHHACDGPRTLFKVSGHESQIRSHIADWVLSLFLTCVAATLVFSSRMVLWREGWVYAQAFMFVALRQRWRQGLLVTWWWCQYFSCCLLLFLFVCFLVLKKFDYDTWFCFGYRCLSHVLTHEKEYFRFWMNQGNSILCFSLQC